ncbi:MAG: polysaccharide deacetylase family protein [Oscillospiraceae bacterium]|nr:polysaccharide deacetylase family protein [Oscillospiraceae bacterium]
MNEKKLAALTFDDGPNTVTTPQVLEKLEKYGVVASFFVVGDNITPESERVMKKAAEMGCEINNHSRTHSVMPEQSPQQMRAETDLTSGIIERVTGKAPRFFRPPYIAVSEAMFESIPLTFIAGIGAQDWLDEVSAEERAQRILDAVKDGDIILLHDMEGNTATVNALDTIIPELISRGFELVTVGGLFAAKGVTPKRGVVYSNVLQENGG